MTDIEIENELIRIFTSSKVRWMHKGGDYFCLEWENYSMWLETPQNMLQNNPRIVRLIYGKLVDSGKKLELSKIPIKALAILAITCRPAYEFYKKYWVKK